jgi:protein-disulfide isomerase
MLKKVMLGTTMLLMITLLVSGPGLSQEDKIVQTAINTVKAQMRVPGDIEIKFVEKKDSPIPDFYSIKLMLSAPDRDIPVVVYVDKEGERVIVGNVIVKGENVTQKEAGQPKPRKIDMAQMDLEKSPFRGAADGKVTIVEFSNFQCPYCLKSWARIQEILAKRSQDVKYVFKHFPLQAQGKAFDISEMVAATQEVSGEAFWTIHDYFFAPDGQAVLNGDKEAIKKKIEEKLNEKGFDGKLFLSALETGKGKKRVQDDLALGTKLRVRGTPTTFMNGDQVRSPITDQVLDQYLKK